MSEPDQPAEREAKASWEILITHRKLWLLLVALVTVVLAFFVPRVKVHTSVRAFIPATAEERLCYERFLDVFGTEQFILIVITNNLGDDGREFLKKLDAVTSKLELVDDIGSVLSITNLKIFRKKGHGLFGTGLVVSKDHEEFRAPRAGELTEARKALPVTDMLLAKDLKTAGIIVRESSERASDASRVGELRERIINTVRTEFPDDSSYRLVGMPIVAEGIDRYTVQTLIYFLSLAAIIGIAVALYIFKSPHNPLIFTICSAVAAVWLLGLMAILEIRVTAITSLGFGMLIVLAASANTHVTTHFYRYLESTGNRIEAAKRSLRVVGRPLMMCSITTGLGFGSLVTVESVTVRQLGVVMAVGAMISFLLVMVLAPILLIRMKPVGPRVFDRMSGDYVSIAFDRLETLVFSHPKICLAAGCIVTVFMAAGALRIEPETHLFDFLKQSTQEIVDFSYVEKSLTPVQTLDLFLEAKPGAFKKPETWRKVESVERRVREIPGVAWTESLLSLLRYSWGLIADANETGDDLFEQGVIPDLLMLTSLTDDGKALVNRHLDEERRSLRISIGIKSDSPIRLSDTVAKILSVAESEMGVTARASVTGYLGAYSIHALGLVRSQAVSLIVSLSAITLAMMIQFRSVPLGLVSLIPNVVPLAVIFGCMGWFGILLSPGTMVVAAVSIGLSVDDTIHYLTQFKREIEKARGSPDLTKCLVEAYRISGRALISTSAILALAFLSLLPAPFQPVSFFGLLGAIAVVTALLADLAFMPSVVLHVTPVRNLVARELSSSR